MHWALAPEVLRPLIPTPLEIDCFEGKAYLGLIPFDIPEVRPLQALPPVPTAGRFLETNLRTYVRLDGRPGVWFFSLEAQSALAVLGARAFFGLPYHHAEMAMTTKTTPAKAAISEGTVDYTSRRIGAAPGQARLELGYEVGPPLGPAALGTLEHFLVERYVLYARHPLWGLVRGEVRHPPYPLRRATVHQLEETLSAAAGISALGAPLPALYSEGVDVDVSPPLRAHRADAYFP